MSEIDADLLQRWKCGDRLSSAKIGKLLNQMYARSEELEGDLELLRSFLWDDHDSTWPEDVHDVLHRAMNRLMAENRLHPNVSDTP